MPNSNEMKLPHLHAVAWETTRKCPLNCIHCRAAAGDSLPGGELSTEEGFKLIDGIAKFAKPMLIITGGEPMSRRDIYDLASYATIKGLRVVMAPCGHLITDESAEKIKSSGIKALSISLDGADASTHDAFRGSPGAFEKSLAGIRCARAAGIHFQINTTVSRINVHQLPQILDLAESIGASAVDFFFLVPTGRGRDLDAELLPTSEYEKTLLWIAEERARRKIRVKTTCAPHFARISRSIASGDGSQGGCLAGGGFVFVSHRGIMQPCGFLDIPCGDLRKSAFNFGKLYLESEVFQALRDPDRYGGKCSVCEFRKVCGGCRARAYAGGGDILAADPTCSHVPSAGNAGEIDESSRNELLLRLQQGIPLERHPFSKMAKELGMEECQVISFITRSFSEGQSRRIGGIFDGRKLGYANTLCAASPLPEKKEEFIQYIRSLPGVTHCYERGWPEELKPGIPGAPENGENYPRLWFTFGTLADNFKAEFAKIEEMNRGGLLLNLPTQKMFKTDVIFDLKQLKRNGPNQGGVVPHKSADTEHRVFSENEKAAIRLLQGNMPVTSDFYADSAARLGLGTDAFLDMLREWQECGILKRISLLLNHLSIGFRANGMCVWHVPEERIEEKGRTLAGYPAITHCYQRAMDKRFPFNLYAMIHAGNWNDLHSVFNSISKENDLSGGQLFCSIREIKKTSMNYFL